MTATDRSSVTIAWPPSRDTDVVGYTVYVNGARVGTETPDQVKRWRDRDLLTYTVGQLACGTGYTVGVDAYDRGDRHSPVTSTTVSTSACPDTTAPSAPGGIRQVATTENSVMLAWSPSSDNVGVVEYGVYASGLRVASSSDASATLSNLACGTSYLVAIDAADAAGNRSAQTSSYLRTSACPSSNQAPSTPTGLKVTAASATSVSLAWTASKDDVAVSGYGLYVGGKRTTDTTKTSADFTGLQCGTTYALGVDAFDGAGKRSTVAELSTATSPCTTTPPPPPPPSTGTVTQTIANGSTLTGAVNWRAVYDKNGDTVEDDPGSIAFYVDGSQVLSEINPPFGDTTGFWASTSVNDGQHTFQVRALTDSGTVLATNTVTATVANTTPTLPPASTGTVTQTIANGSTLTGAVNWRAVYDKNGDNVPDDPGSIRFLIDGNPVLTEATMPFGDTTGFWTSTSVGNGSHTFEVRAFNDAGAVVASNSVTASVENTTASAGDSAAPSTPTSLRVASSTPTSVTTAWNAATDNVAVTGYDLYRGSSKTGQTQQTTATYGGLNCGTAYQVGVDAYDAAGNASSQATMSVTTSPCTDTQPPTAPTNVTASNRTTTSISLSWAPATDNIGVAAYGIYNGTDLIDTTAGTTGIVSGLTCGTNYTLAVDAFDASGNSSPKTTVMVATLPCTDTTPPSQPTNLRTTSTTTTSATLAWNPATDNVAVSGYDIYRATTKVGSTTTTTYTITGLTCATTYTAGVKALDNAGNTSTQATTTLTTTACPPTTPTPTTCPLPAYPDANCTGVPPGTTLTPSGGLTISTAGTVIDGRDITGQVVVNAPNVTIRNSRIRSNTMWVIQNNSTGLLVEDSEIINRPVSGQNNCHNAIGDANFTVRRTEITGCENGLNVGSPGNVTLEDSWIHDLDITGPSYVFGNSPHTDGIQFPFGNASNIRIRHNTIDPTPGNSGATSAIIMTGENGPESDVRIEDNLIDGRGAAAALYAPRQQTTAVYVNRNKMYKGVYGLYTFCVRPGVTVTEFNDNRDAGTNAVISPDNGSGGGCTN